MAFWFILEKMANQSGDPSDDSLRYSKRGGGGGVGGVDDMDSTRFLYQSNSEALGILRTLFAETMKAKAWSSQARR